MKRLYFLSFVLFLMAHTAAFAQPKIDRIEPPFWWADMDEPVLQLLVHGENLAKLKVDFRHENMELVSVKMTDNPNYCIVELFILPEVTPGSYDITFTQDEQNYVYSYELKQRRPESAQRKGFNNSDVIYLMMPDRFANGDPGNDDVAGMLEKADRNNPNGRHGGDLLGIENNLGYLKDLGVTSIWLNPVFENNMPQYSYHGYAITDFYQVDPRFGSNEDYKKLVGASHQTGIKVIMDMVFNHCGSYHKWMNDMPAKDWFNQHDEFTRSNYRGGAIIDPHASKYDQDKMLKGWFDKTMPDLNQKNEYLAKYLIQNSIWWIEYADLDGIRMDTYPYSDKDFMAKWMQTIYQEYPNFNVVGESWLGNSAMVAYWQDRSNIRTKYNSNLETLFDFPLFYAMGKAFTEENTWDKGIVRLYESLTQDFLYANPNDLVIFADNHDVDRFYTSIGENKENFEMAMAFLMTTRGIPMIYYGTELGMTGHENKGHGDIRKDFPSGWDADGTNAFTKTGRDNLSVQTYDYLQKLLNWRKTNKAVQTGTLTHFIPEDGVYVYFRKLGEESVMVILNNSDKDQTLKTERFAECLQGYKSGKEAISGKKVGKLGSIDIPKKSTLIIELVKE
jgi:neopullulanase